MFVFGSEHLRRYLADGDAVGALLEASREGDDASLTAHRWLVDSAPKRLIFEHLYGDLLRGAGTGRTVLDVGGAYSSLSRVLARRHRYQVLDIMAHDDHRALEAVAGEIGEGFWIDSDWNAFDAGGRTWDVVVANDLFPNVDQRLATFLETYLPLAREIRLSLTYYDTPRSYRVKRVDADEILWLLAWDGRRVADALRPLASRIVDADLDCLEAPSASLFPNGRQVCHVVVRGTAAGGGDAGGSGR